MVTDRNTYEQFADQYASMIENDHTKEFSTYSHLVVPALLERVGDVSGLKVLDAGCGEGYVSRILSDRGADVTGIDISLSLIEFARVRDEQGGIDYHAHDLSKLLPQYGAKFDLVVSNLVLNDVFDYLGFIDTISSVTRLNGHFVLSINNPYSAVIRDKVTNYFDSGEWINYTYLEVPYFHRTLEDYMTAFLNAGFLLRGLSDVQPSEELLTRTEEAQRYFHFPFFMVLDFVKGGA